MKEKRKYKRVKVNSPLSFTGIDTGGFTIEGGMGLVRDINPTGIQIETFLPLQSEYIGLTFVDLKKREINASGRVIYCTENESG